MANQEEAKEVDELLNSFIGKDEPIGVITHGASSNKLNAIEIIKENKKEIYFYYKIYKTGIIKI